MRSIYDDIWQRGSESMLLGRSEVDKKIDDPSDSRRGITLVFRPDPSLLGSFGDFLRRVEEVEPNQYFYEPSEIHTTVISIITCSEKFSLDQVDVSEYAQVVRSCVEKIDPFIVEFTGITASAGCVMAQGFPVGDGLERLRESLRETFRSSPLHHSIDQRYAITTAHSTLVRFRNSLSRPRELVDLILQFRDTELGCQHVTDLALVSNDWYHKSGRVVDIAHYQLSAARTV